MEHRLFNFAIVLPLTLFDPYKELFFFIIFQKPEVFVSVFPTQSTQLIPNCSIVSFHPLLQPSVLYFRLCPFMIFYLIYWAILTLLYSSVVLDFRWRETRQLKCSGQKVWTLASKLRASFVNTELNAECEFILFIHTESLVAVGDIFWCIDRETGLNSIGSLTISPFSTDYAGGSTFPDL